MRNVAFEPHFHTLSFTPFKVIISDGLLTE